MENKKRTIWKVISFRIDGIRQIQQINKKLGKHLEGIKSIHVSVIPTSEVKDNIIEAGELSLLVNNQKDNPVHITSSYSPDMLSKSFSPLLLNHELKSQSVSGYYRDYGTLRNEFSEFITHEVKVLLECTIK